MGAITKAMNRSRAVVSTAHSQVVRQKQGGAQSQLVQSDLAGMYDMGRQAKNRRNYELMRGWLYSAVNALASEAASQPVMVGTIHKKEEEKKDGRRRPKESKLYHTNKMTKGAQSKAADQELEVYESHPLLDILQHPNPIQHKWQFVYTFVANLCFTGWGYIVAGKKKDGGIELYSLPTTWVKPDHRKGPFAEFRLVNPKRIESQDDTPPLTRDQVAFAHLPNPSDPLSALAPVSSQLSAIRIDDHIQTSQELFFENGIFPSAVVTVGKDPHPDAPGGIRPRLTGTQRRQVYGAIRKIMSGVANYGNPAIVDGLIEKIEKLQMNQSEMGWDKSEDKTRARILSAFAVHPYILGEAVSVGGYAQVASIERRFCKRVNTFLDMLGILLTNFAGGSIESKNDLLVWFEKTEPQDPSLYWTNIRDARNREDISQNEYRALLGFPPDEDENEAILNKAMLTPLSQLLGQVGTKIRQEQLVAIIEGLGVPTDLAKRIAGVGLKPLPKPTPPVPPGAGAQEQHPAQEDSEDDEQKPLEGLQTSLSELRRNPNIGPLAVLRSNRILRALRE